MIAFEHDNFDYTHTVYTQT